MTTSLPKAQPLPRDARADALAPAGGAARGQVPVCVLVPVLNEAKNLPRCLEALRFAAQVAVVDSSSADLTVPTAQAHGAEVYRFDYDRLAGWPKKKNWALENVPWRHDWVLVVDADEVIPPELAEEIAQVVAGRWQPKNAKEAGSGEAYWISRRFRFMGRWIRGCGYWPSWNIRLFRHAVGRYERIGLLGDTGTGDNEVHEHVVLSRGKAGHLRHAFDHFAYPDVATFIEKHNRYSTWEAHAQLAGAGGEIVASPFGHGTVSKRRFLRRVSLKLPFRPTLRFLYSYVVERGFMDGYEGFMLCRLLAWYELASMAKAKEMTQGSPGNAGIPATPQPADLRSVQPPAALTPTGANAGTPTLAPEKSPWTTGEKIRRALWMLVGKPIFRLSFHNWYGPRAALLRLFGAQIGKGTRIRPSADIEIPWMLCVGDGATVGDHAILYSLGSVRIGARAVVSQYAHLCAGTHDHTRRDFPLLRLPVTVGADAWIGADAFVGPGVSVGDRAILGARASAFRDVPADEIHAGNPAKKIKDRILQ